MLIAAARIAVVVLTLGGAALAGPPETMVVRVVRTGDEPPDRPGETFTTFSEPSIGNSGAVAFRGEFDGPLSGNEGIYRFDGATLERLVDDSFDFTPPGQGGASSWSSFGPPVVNDSGDVLFSGNFSFGENEHGLYVHQAGGLELIFDDNPLQQVPGQPRPMPPVPPGGPGFTTFPFSASLLPLLSSNGFGATTAEFRDSSLVLHDGLYLGSAAYGIVGVADDTLAPPGQPNALFTDLSPFTRIVMSSAGDVAFLASYVGAPSGEGLYRYDRVSATLGRVADTTTGPHDQPGTVFVDIDPVFSMNGAGHVAFAAQYAGGTGNLGIYVDDGAGGVTTVVDNSGVFEVPGHRGASFLALGEPVINDAGYVVFAATFVGPGVNSGGVFKRTPQGLVTILDLTGVVPGQPTASFTAVGHRVMSAGGHVALTALYSGGSGNEGIYLHDGATLHRVVDESRTLAGDTATDLRMMATLGPGGSGSADGKPRTLNDDDHITFWAQLAGGGEAIYLVDVDLPCTTDLSGDGSTEVVDLLELLAAWGTSPGGPPDFDGGGVGTTDLLILLAAWGPCR